MAELKPDWIITCTVDLSYLCQELVSLETIGDDGSLLSFHVSLVILFAQTPIIGSV